MLRGTHRIAAIGQTETKTARIFFLRRAGTKPCRVGRLATSKEAVVQFEILRRCAPQE